MTELPEAKFTREHVLPRPFTEKSVRELLLGGVLRQGRQPTSGEITNLTRYLNELRSSFLRHEPIRQEEERSKRIAVAIQTLTDELSHQTIIHGAAISQDDLEALQRLLQAARAVRRRGLPLHSLTAMFGGATARWKDFAARLQDLFLQSGFSKEGSYRLIVAITPQITEETPTREAVRTFLMRRR